MELSFENILPSIKAALAEDIGTGDVTTEATISEQTKLKGRFIAKETGVIAGLSVSSCSGFSDQIKYNDSES